MLFFNNENQDKKYLNNLPHGRIFKQAKKEGTNFNNLIKWVGSGFEWLTDKYNQTFKGLFICQSDLFIEEFKRDYSIPNEVFYETTKEEHIADIKVLKYLMKSNLAWNFQAIAQMYGVCVEVRTGIAHFELSKLPAKLPYKLYNVSDFVNINNVLVIVFFGQDATVLPYKLPYKLGTGLKIKKIKNIYDRIKPAQTTILYVRDFDSVGNCGEINLCN